jgi:hypothetical protein
MESMKAPPEDMVAAYEKIAQEILERPESFPNSLHNILLKLAETHPGAVYWVVRKFFTEYLRLHVSDTGYIGIADRFLPDIMYPGDVAIYMTPENLKPGDVVQVTFTDKEEVSIFVVHARVETVKGNNAVEVRDIRTGEQYSVVAWNLLGKLVKVIPFNTEEWKELYVASGVEGDWIATRIQENIQSIKDSEREDKGQILEELKGRLSQLV